MLLKRKGNLLLTVSVLLTFFSCQKNEITTPETFYYKTININGQEGKFTIKNAAVNTEIALEFSAPIDKVSASRALSLKGPEGNVPLNVNYSNNDSTLLITTQNALKYMSKYTFSVSEDLLTKNQTQLNSNITATILTQIDSTDKFQRISDEELLTKIQSQTFKYFWDFGHPVSGLSRERDTSGDLVTSGGSGFGIMAIPVGIERGFISRAQGLERLQKITDFLLTKTTTYHGVFPHWFNGSTGATIPFSTKDNGADLVETSYLMMGLLTARSYFDRNTEEEKQLRASITTLWENVEWDWFTKGGENVLYWHWSPTYNWDMNLPLRGWNEGLITYILAAASPTHSISKEVYSEGWARNGGMKNGNKFYNHILPLGSSLGGPLFFEHYTFLGIDPRNLKDSYADYWEQVTSHTLINHDYCVDNPKNFAGYSQDCWGLTASDTYGGYTAHSPTNDVGVISPTAALSSIAYTPEESMKALHFFYYKIGDKLFKNYGFTDAFSIEIPWFASSFLAIDQGPIIGMIENYRTGLLWKLTMKDPDIQKGLDKLDFTY